MRIRKYKNKTGCWYQSFPDFFINTNTRQVLRIIRAPGRGKANYFIRVEDRDREKSITITQGFEEKTEVVKQAWEWMIEHPEGITFEGGN